ncbi:MAG: methyltransferase domain-containing protein [Chloroflexi bacterium]|nr:methyltransferase domain-containing protein [Chloroflexota bacterium]
MNARRTKYIPALGSRWLTPLYDPMMRLLLHEATFKRHLVQQASIKEGDRVLDLGCGTATLTVMIKQAQPGAEVVGLDADPEVLRIGRSKAAKARVDIAFNLGTAFSLPYRDRSFDRVVSSLVFHHLSTENKRAAFSESVRVLRPGGELHVADFGKPHNTRMRLVSLAMRRFEKTPDNIQGRLPQLFRDAGFEGVAETARYSTIFGTLSFYSGKRPSPPFSLDGRRPG